jgi:hypothetical protein
MLLRYMLCTCVTVWLICLFTNKGNNKITELRTILQRESQTNRPIIKVNDIYISMRFIRILNVYNQWPI